MSTCQAYPGKVDLARIEGPRFGASEHRLRSCELAKSKLCGSESLAFQMSVAVLDPDDELRVAVRIGYASQAQCLM